MSASEFAEKIRRVVAFLEREETDAVLLNAQHNFAWITGGASNGIDHSREAGAASILVSREGRAFLLANNIEMQRMLDEQVRRIELEPIQFSWQHEKASTGTVREAVRSAIGSDARLATDIPMFGDTSAIDGKLGALRLHLTEEERSRFRDLGQDASRAMDAAIQAISPGQSELEIAEALRCEMARRTIVPVVLLVAADERISMYRHPLPTGKAWERTLLLVVCARRSGLIASLSRMVSNGVPDDDLFKRTEAAASVNASLWNATRSGATGSELYQVAAEAYERSGFGTEIDKHHQGGAAGYKTREWVAHPASKDEVVQDQAFSWNPSVTGTKVEETILFSENGIEVLTASSLFPKIQTTIEGHDHYSSGILTIN
ncbi:MAG TPA: M24 family metallopeptidase [Pyrinomonadaceae bacterium]|nr:M24 family metallopeptidase [Pyrinomonadaceae bacterium]